MLEGFDFDKELRCVGATGIRMDKGFLVILNLEFKKKKKQFGN